MRYSISSEPSHRRVLSAGRALAALMLAIAVAPPASAEGILGAFIGTTFGGVTEVNATVFGGVLGGVKSGGGLGFEIDFGYSPDFLGTEDETGVKTSITTVMGNVVFGGGARRGVAPYLSGGIGLIRANVEAPGDLIENLSANDFGFNVGGGVNIPLGGTFGLSGDIRYFRSLKSNDEDGGVLGFGLDEFDFWRGAVGLIVRW